MKNFPCLALLAFMLLLSACGGAAMPTSSRQEVAAPPSAAGAPVQEPGTAGSGFAADENRAPVDAPVGQAVPGDVARLVIKTAQLTLEVDGVSAAEGEVRARVANLGGYVVSVQTSGTEPNLYTSMVVRVPSDRFEEALSGVQGMAKRVVNRALGGEDVTEEFVDLDSRLRNLEATRDRLLAFLDKTTNVADALQINQALTDVQGQIEQIKGRMQYLKQSAAMATLTINLQPVPTTPIIDESSWQPVQVFRRALRDLVEFGQGLAELAIVLAVWLPIWLPIILLARWGWRRMRRAFAKPISPAKPVEPAAADNVSA